jgi:arsenite methyltransferase
MPSFANALTRVPQPLPDLDGLLAWIACIGDAQPVERYAEWLVKAGFAIAATGERDECLQRMIDEVQSRLLLADIMIGLRKLDLPGLDLAQAKTFATAARRAVLQKQVGYALVVAQKRPH